MSKRKRRNFEPESRAEALRPASKGVVAIVAIVAAMLCSCGPEGGEISAQEGDGMGSISSSGNGSGASETSAGQSSSGTTGVEGWPERWYGDFYVTGLALGDPQSVIGTATNISLAADSVIWTDLYCSGNETTLVGSYAGDEAEIVFEAGGTWSRGVLHPPIDGDCGRLELYVYDPEGEQIGEEPIQVLRGRLFISDDCSEDAEWAADLDPDVPTTCPE